MRLLRWLYPGIGVKRWLLLCTLGILVFCAGILMAMDASALWEIQAAIARVTSPKVNHPASPTQGFLVVLVGAVMVGIGLTRIIRAVYQASVPRGGESLGKLLFQRKNLEHGPRIVAIGGGTGLSTLLRGLKEYTDNLTAVVTVSDDGGSSGRLRQELGILPPGDIRNCLVAMADTEPLLERLFQHRFKEGAGLSGHNFGNLFIAALTEVTGDFEEAVRQSSKVLAVRGRVLPTTLEDVMLYAEMEDGRHVRGESAISAAGGTIKHLYVEPGDARALPDVLTAIKEADAIVLGPGSLYTSVISNLLVPGVAHAVRSSGALKVYVCNIMTQPGETSGFTAADHARAVIHYGGEGLLDIAMVNAREVPNALLERYVSQGQQPVNVDRESLLDLGISVIEEDLVGWDGVIRHSPEKLAEAIMRTIIRLRGNALRQRLLEAYFTEKKG